MRITLRAKTLAVVGLTLATFNAALYALVSRRVERSFEDLEQRETGEDMARVMAALGDALWRLQDGARDYATWSETYTSWTTIVSSGAAAGAPGAVFRIARRDASDMAGL